MLSPLDDYPVHQIAEPIRHVATGDRNFYDRYYFNIHHCNDDLFCVIGLGQYPNLGVTDGFVALRRHDMHRVIRASRELGVDRTDTSVGPLRVEVVEGLRRLRVVLEENEWGVALDAVFAGSMPAHLEPRHFFRRHHRVLFDSVRLAQVGTWSGTLRIDGAEFELDGNSWRGSRDRSWGVRPVGEAEPPGIQATDAGGGFFWIYAPMQFEDTALHVIVQEDPDGTRVVEGAHQVFAFGSPREGDVVDVGRVEHELRFAPGTREVSGATLRCTDTGGAVVEVDIEVLLPIELMLGTGYGLEADWRHGMWQGPLCVQGVDYDLADPSHRPFGVIDTVARFTWGDRVGFGLFEYAVIGPHEKYGFTSWDDVGP